MKFIAVLLILLGVLGIYISDKMFGDIGLSGMIGSIASLLAGIGLWSASRNISRIERDIFVIIEKLAEDHGGNQE